MVVLTLDLDLIVDVEPGVSLGEKLFDQFPADLLFLDEHLKDLVAEEALARKPFFNSLSATHH